MIFTSNASQDESQIYAATWNHQKTDKIYETYVKSLIIRK